jgi:hypothetical protein
MPALALLSPRTTGMLILALLVAGALLLAVPGLGGPVIHWPPGCPPMC